MPPSTANSVKALPLSIAMASKMALVWKQAASMVARAMCPFCVCAVIPPGKKIGLVKSQNQEALGTHK